MGAALDLPVDRLDDLRMAMAEEERAMAAEIIDIAIAVDIPLPRSLGPRDVEPVGLDIARIVGDAAREEPARLLGGARGARSRRTIASDDRRIRRQRVRHAPHSSAGSSLDHVVGPAASNEKGRPEGAALPLNR